MKIKILWYIDGICDLQRDLVGVSLDYFKVTTTGFPVFDRKNVVSTQSLAAVSSNHYRRTEFMMDVSSVECEEMTTASN
jgi:hypothetical protein